MKNSFGVGVWRPLLGVVVLGGLALGVSALAAPRGADQPASRGGKERVGTEPTQLVTGNPTQINSVVAGTPPTSVMEIVPVPAKVGAQAYTITGNSISAANGGFRAWFEVKISNWDPSGDGLPALKAAQTVLDASGYMSGNGDPLAPASVVCGPNPPATAHGICAAAFGESHARCDLAGVSHAPNTCFAGYAFGETRADSICPTCGGCNPPLDQSLASLNYNWFWVGDGTCFDGPPAGQKYYSGTLVLDVPAGARGTYCVNLDQDNTFMADGSQPPVNIATAAENGFCVVIETGSCCYDLANPAGASCTDKLKAKECGDDEIGPFVWTKDKLCSQGCVECINDGGCDDQDSCTTERCSSTSRTPPDAADGICIRGVVSDWQPATECCDGSGPTAAITTINDGDDCTCDSCSEADSRGSAQHPACVASCNDANPCTTDDTCDGVNTGEAACSGTDINTFACPSGDVAECPEGAQSCTDNVCVCTLTPKVTFEVNSPAPKTCSGGFNDGLPCAKDTDCSGGGFCDLFANGANCFDLGAKVSALIHIGAAASPINGGQFNIAYDPTCVELNSATCLAPYTEQVYSAADGAIGKLFIACGVDPFLKTNGPLGSVDIVALNFTMIGECAGRGGLGDCELSFQDKNPLNNYLVDDEGQAVNIEGQAKQINAKGDLVLEVPDNIKVNSDCDVPAAEVTWDAPSASFSCGDTNLSCRGAHENGTQYSQAIVNGGGLLPQGASSFCCYASAKDKCDQAAGCQGRVNDCPGTTKPDGCWTVEVNDEISLDIHVQLEPPIAAGELTRCIEFCMYGPCTDAPACFFEDIVFGGLLNYIGKADGKIKVPKGKWGCITAQDQIHSLRSCDSPDCIDGQLVARFKGDPLYGGNWLVQGNLDAWKKDDPKASQDTIDILDFGMFVSQMNVCYTGFHGCHDGPHADLNGDGCVTAADYNFILRNFLASSKDCCCGPQGPAGGLPTLVEVSVDELHQMGLGDLAVADLNGDGVVNAKDMDAFSEGVRPVKANDRKGVKGLRSGR